MTTKEIKSLENQLAGRVGDLGNAVIDATSDAAGGDPDAYEAARRAASDVSAMIARLDFAQRKGLVGHG
jgi:hypothetical protein